MSSFRRMITLNRTLKMHTIISFAVKRDMVVHTLTAEIKSPATDMVGEIVCERKLI